MRNQSERVRRGENLGPNAVGWQRIHLVESHVTVRNNLDYKLTSQDIFISVYKVGILYILSKLLTAPCDRFLARVPSIQPQVGKLFIAPGSARHARRGTSWSLLAANITW